jgi:hypothetical protein
MLGEGFGVKNIHCWASYLIRTTARGEVFGENKLLERVTARRNYHWRGVSLGTTVTGEGFGIENIHCWARGFPTMV